MNEADWAAFAETLDYVPLAAGAGVLKGGGGKGGEARWAARAAGCTI